jgi:hypothetical protein
MYRMTRIAAATRALSESRVGYAPCAETPGDPAGMMLSGQALAMTLGQWIVLTGGGPRQPAPVAEATCQEVIVSQVRVHNFSVSLDGFGTGEGQSLDAPFGHAGTRLHEWLQLVHLSAAPIYGC